MIVFEKEQEPLPKLVSSANHFRAGEGRKFKTFEEDHEYEKTSARAIDFHSLDGRLRKISADE